jgi:hypothetical protein
MAESLGSLEMAETHIAEAVRLMLPTCGADLTKALVAQIAEDYVEDELRVTAPSPAIGV